MSYARAARAFSCVTCFEAARNRGREFKDEKNTVNFDLDVLALSVAEVHLAIAITVLRTEPAETLVSGLEVSLEASNEALFVALDCEGYNLELELPAVG